MKRRSGISYKVQDSSVSCYYCKLHIGSLSCLLCNKIVCENCICDKSKKEYIEIKILPDFGILDTDNNEMDNDSVTKSKFDNLYGCKHSCSDTILRSTDIMIKGKKHYLYLYHQTPLLLLFLPVIMISVVYMTEIDPICALQAYMQGYQVVRIEDIVSEIDIFVTSTSNKDIIRYEHMIRMKNNAIVSNIGHFDNETR
jgi:adenosylhomocysteinase